MHKLLVSLDKDDVRVRSVVEVVVVIDHSGRGSMSSMSGGHLQEVSCKIWCNSICVECELEICNTTIVGDVAR